MIEINEPHTFQVFAWQAAVAGAIIGAVTFLSASFVNGRKINENALRWATTSSMLCLTIPGPANFSAPLTTQLRSVSGARSPTIN